MHTPYSPRTPPTLQDAGTALRSLATWAATFGLLTGGSGCGAEGTTPAANVADTAPALDQSGGADGISAADAAANDGGANSDSGASADAAADLGADAAPADTAKPDGAPDDSGDAKQPADAGPQSDVDGDSAAAGNLDAAEDAPPAADTGPTGDAEPDASSEDTADGGPTAPQPEPAQLGPPVAAQVDLLWNLQPSFVAAGHGAIVLAQAGTLTVFLEQPGLAPVLLQGDPGPARSMAVMPGPQYLLATAKGLYGLQGKKWGVSPVQPWIGAAPQWLLVQPGAGGSATHLWIGQAEGLWRHDGQLLQPVAVPAADLTAALLQGPFWSIGPKVALPGPNQGAVNLVPALWLYAGGAARALTTASNTAQVWHDQDLPTGKQLAGDGGGQLWWLNKDGTLHRRDPEGAWQWLALPEAATAIAALPNVPYGAVATAKGLWLQQDGIFFPVLGTTGMQLRGMTANGEILAVSKQGLVRVTPGQPTPPPPTSWAKDIQPIHDAKCSTCHGPAAVTVKLNTAALWKQWFVKIQKQLATDAMPLVGTKLTAAQKALVKSWGTGNFAP